MSCNPEGVELTYVRPLQGRGTFVVVLKPWVAPMAIQKFDPFRIIKVLQNLQPIINKNHDQELVE
ncbi:hypothetical protein LV84_02570, partial [Algoriphagus ratkowskyi]